MYNDNADIETQDGATHYVSQSSIIDLARLIEDINPESLPEITNWPDWAVCHAFDKDGEGYYYNTLEIKINDEEWVLKDPFIKYQCHEKSGLTLPPGYDWRETLVLKTQEIYREKEEKRQADLKQVIDEGKPIEYTCGSGWNEVKPGAVLKQENQTTGKASIMKASEILEDDDFPGNRYK